MDLFDIKNIKPMLVGIESDPFDSDNHIFELKLDGIRCIAYLDNNTMELRTKRNLRVSGIYPELSNINKQVNARCILDGELIVMNHGRPDFDEVRRRTLMSNKLKIELAASQLAASFTAFDILYYENKQITDLPLMERKDLLEKTISENNKLSISRYIEDQGKAFYKLAELNELEGIVAKRKESRYYFDKRTKDWIKIKYYKDEDYVVCGYIRKTQGMTSIVLGQYHDQELIYKGHVSLGVSGSNYKEVTKLPRLPDPPFSYFPFGSGKESAIWVSPELVCTVKYMPKSENDSTWQRVFKGIRDDKSPENCME